MALCSVALRAGLLALAAVSTDAAVGSNGDTACASQSCHEEEEEEEQHSDVSLLQVPVGVQDPRKREEPEPIALMGQQEMGVTAKGALDSDSFARELGKMEALGRRQAPAVESGDADADGQGDGNGDDDGYDYEDEDDDDDEEGDDDEDDDDEEEEGDEDASGPEESSNQGNEVNAENSAPAIEQNVPESTMVSAAADTISVGNTPPAPETPRGAPAESRVVSAAVDAAGAMEPANPRPGGGVSQIAPFGREDTAGELQNHASRTQDTLVDAVENAEVAEIKRAVFRSLTKLRAAEIKEFDTIARLETQAIDEYNDGHHYRAENPLEYLDSSEPAVGDDKYTSFHD